MTDVKQYIKLCSRCKTQLTIDRYSIRANDVHYTSCNPCRESAKNPRSKHREMKNEYRRNSYISDPTIRERKKKFNTDKKEHIEAIRTERIKCDTRGRHIQRSYHIKHLCVHCHPTSLNLVWHNMLHSVVVGKLVEKIFFHFKHQSLSFIFKYIA